MRPCQSHRTGGRTTAPGGLAKFSRFARSSRSGRDERYLPLGGRYRSYPDPPGTDGTLCPQSSRPYRKRRGRTGRFVANGTFRASRSGWYGRNELSPIVPSVRSDHPVSQSLSSEIPIEPFFANPSIASLIARFAPLRSSTGHFSRAKSVKSDRVTSRSSALPSTPSMR